MEHNDDVLNIKKIYLQDQAAGGSDLKIQLLAVDCCC